MALNSKERIFNAIEFKAVDRIPKTFRATETATIRLAEHFGLKDPKDTIGNRKEIIKRLGADSWSSGCRPDKFSVFLPAYTGPGANPPFIEDDQYYYTIGINTAKSDISPFYGVNPVLADAQTPNDIKDGFLTSKLK